MAVRRWVCASAALAVGALSAAPARADTSQTEGAAELARTEPVEPARATSKGADPFAARFSVMAGLSQWILFRGGNVAFEYETGRLALEVSHGQGLDFDQAGGLARSSAERSAGAHVRVPWTTGFGAGVRILPDLLLLVEFKAHRYDVRGLDPRSTASYTTFSIGPGVFYTIHLYRGLFLQPNVRFWPNVASTLGNDHAALRQPDGSRYDHAAHDLGVFANVNLGYGF